MIYNNMYIVLVFTKTIVTVLPWQRVE